MFLKNKIIQHYARVFLEYSIINRINSEIFYHKIKKTSDLLNNNTYICQILCTHLINSEKKIKIFKNIFYNFDILLFQFVKLLIIKKRESFLKEILLEYQKIYEKDQKGIVTPVIISAYSLNKDIQEMIVQKILNNNKNNNNNKKFHIINEIDPSIIGGFIFRIEYKEWNFSIQKQLFHIKKTFQNF
ncbi:ATP synthase F1 subunit delta [Blattabacterium cuenoti]|uniref:ATP synthase F1 subunit delta n=1 Tax=Blattabacterium cuenoti TaxID=1653831 RepID=UPI00163C22BA|nr:ATP synthase F1 subunit delta [Blattabacterium cuenoti]